MLPVWRTITDTLINNGKVYHTITMIILIHDQPKKDPNFPDLGELVTLLNGVMSYPLLISERGSAASAEEDCSGVLCSKVEEGSADLD